MGKIVSLVASFCLFVLVAVVGYVKVGVKTEAVNPRLGIDKGIDQVKQSNKLQPAEESLLRVQLAVNDYLIRNAAPPPSLASLVPLYFDAVPTNPETNQPFEYVKTGNTYRIGAPGQGRMHTASAAGEAKSEKGGAASEKGADSGNSGEVGRMAVSANGGSDIDYINPNLIETDTFVYDSAGKRDPFQPWDLQRSSQIDPNKSPLEQYDIKQLRLTAVLGDADGGRTALVEDSFGKGYTVKIGTRVGNAGGVVAAIEAGSLKVIETRVDFNGVEKQELVEVKIQASSLTKSDKRDMKKGKMSSIGQVNNERRKKR